MHKSIYLVLWCMKGHKSMIKYVIYDSKTKESIWTYEMWFMTMRLKVAYEFIKSIVMYEMLLEYEREYELYRKNKESVWAYEKCCDVWDITNSWFYVILYSDLNSS